MVFPRLFQTTAYQAIPNSSINPSCPVVNVVKPGIPYTSSSSTIEQQNIAVWTVQAG